MSHKHTIAKLRELGKQKQLIVKSYIATLEDRKMKSIRASLGLSD